MTKKHGPRAEPIKAAIEESNATINDLVRRQRRMLEDRSATPDQMAKINAELRAHTDKRDGLVTSLQLANKLDARDVFLANREAIKAKAEEMLQLIGTRSEEAAEVDAACQALGAALSKMAAKNQAAWSLFRDVAKALTLGDVRRARYETLIFANQPRISTGASFGSALVYALKHAGVGSVAISADVLYPVGSYRSGNPLSVAETVRQENNKVEQHLDQLFRQAADEVAHLLAAQEEADAAGA